jgi:hypothetical protein
VTDYAQAVARVLSARILEARTTTARGTVTAVTADGFVTFSDAVGTSRKGVWLTQQPAIGSVITYLDEGHGIPLVLGSSGTTAWTAPTLLNGWVNYGGEWATAAYRKVGDIVYIRGLVKDGSVPADIFVLPTGYRPPAGVLFAVDTGTPGRLDVHADGRVAAQAGSAGYFALNCSFSTT